jgi:hypothetical protein
MRDEIDACLIITQRGKGAQTANFAENADL